MPDGKAFFDTNIVVYAFATGERRREKALGLLLAGGRMGVQTINEFVNVYSRKSKTPWADIELWLNTALKLCPDPVPLTLSVH